MRRHQPGADRATICGLLAGTALSLGGCVQVTAPTDPIVITLNINIRQEVVYRLDGDARQLIEQNTEIF